MTSGAGRWGVTLLVAALVLAPLAGVAGTVSASTGPTTTLLSDDPSATDFDACYVRSNAQNNEVLQQTNKTTGAVTDVGTPGQGEDITDMSFQPGTGVLFAVQNSEQLGTLSLTDGSFTPIGGTGFGVANGSLGDVNIDSVDGLSFDPTTGVLYAMHERSQSRDLLLVVDPATGNHVPNAFGPDVDYVALDRVGTGNDDVDGLAVDPTDGQMYGIGNDPGASDNLIAIDKTTGVATDVGELGVNNLEGMSFDLNGDLYGVTTSAQGVQGGNTLYTIDTGTGLATEVGPLDAATTADTSGDKYLSVACGLGGPGVQSADLSLTKSANRTTVPQGETVAFTVTVTNDGPDATTNVSVQDVLPSGLTFVSASPGQGSYDSGTGLWTVGSLANGSSATLTIVAEATGPVGAQVENEAAVETSDVDDPDSVPGDGVRAPDDWDSTLVTIAEANQADLSLSKTVDESAPGPGDSVTYTVSVTNDGPQDATNVTVDENVPSLSGLSVTGTSTSQGTYSAGTWNVGTVTAGSTATLTITATVEADATQTVTNLAEVTAATPDDPDSTPGDGAGDDFDDATLFVTEADLSVDKTVDDATPSLGDDVTFTVTVTNTGPDATSGVVLEDQLPAGLTFVSASPSQGLYNATTGVWDVGSLANGGSATLTITAEATQVGEFTNVAAVNASDQADTDSTNDDDSSTVTVAEQDADLSVSKTVDDDAPFFGETTNFTVTVTNDGPGDATGVTVSDDLPDGLDYVASSASQGSYDSGTGAWDVGTLASGATATLTIEVRANTTDPVANVATVFGDQPDPDETDNEDAELVDPQAVADLSVNKTANRTTISAGEDVAFTVTVTNEGPNDATNVSLVDDKPAGLVELSNTTSQGSYDGVTEVWTVGDLAAGETATLTLVASADGPDSTLAGAELRNVAFVAASDQADDDESDDSDDAVLTVEGVQPPPTDTDLELSKSANVSTVAPGDGLQYTITVNNTGANDATSVVVEDITPAGVTVTGTSTSDGTYDATTNTWDVGTIAQSGTATLTIDVSVDATEGTIENIAEVESMDQNDTDSTPGNNVYDETEDDWDSATVTVTQPLTSFISGRVSDQDNNDIENALVEIVDEDTGALVGFTLTDSEGDYTVEVPAGNFTVRASKTGYSSAEQTGVDVPPNKTVTVNLVLVRQPLAETITVTPPAAETTADNESTLTYTVTVRDAQGQPVDGVDVAVTDDGTDVFYTTPTTRTTGADGTTTFTVKSPRIQTATLTFTVVGNSALNTSAEAAFTRSGEGVISGIVDDSATTDQVEDASVWAVSITRYRTNQESTTLDVGALGDDDPVYWVRLVDADTGAVLDADDYDVRRGDGVTSIRKIAQLNTSDATVGEGVVVIDADGDGTVTLNHTRLAPEEYYLQYSADAGNASDERVADDGSESFDNYTSGGSTLVFAPTENLTLAGTAARAAVTGSNAVDSPGFVNSYGYDTGGTNDDGRFVLNRLATDYQNGTAYVAAASKTGYRTDFQDVVVAEDGESTSGELQLSRHFQLEPEPVEPDAVNITQVGTHPALARSGGAYDPALVTPFADQGDDTFQRVARDGTVDVIRVETGASGPGGVTPLAATVTVDLNASFDGQFLNATPGGTLVANDRANATITVDTGEDGVATVLLETEVNDTTLQTRKNAVLANDPGATDHSNVTFVGSVVYETGSVSGIVTNENNEPIVGSVVYTAEFVDSDGNAFRVTPVGSLEGLDREGVRNAQFNVTDVAGGENVTVTGADLEAYRIDDADAGGFERVSLSGARSVTLLTFPSQEQGQAQYTLPRVPATDPDGVDYTRVRAVELDSGNDGTGDTDSNVTVGFTQEANVVIPGAEPGEGDFQVANLDADSTVAQGDVVTVTAEVTNTDVVSGTKDVEFRFGAGALTSQTVLLTEENVTLAPGQTTTVTFEVPTDGVATGTYNHGVFTEDDSETTTIEVTDGDAGASLVDGYDTNGEAGIQLLELSDAAQDYSDGEISLQELAQVARAYSNG